MLFGSRTLVDVQGSYSREAILLSDAKDVIFHVRVPKDVVAAWVNGFLVMMETGDGARHCQRLVENASQIRWCKLHVQASQVTFWKVVFALQRFLERAESASLSGRQNALQALYRLLKEKFNFWAFYESKNQGYAYGVVLNGKEILNEFRPLSLLTVEEARQSYIREEWWTSSIDKLYRRDADCLGEVLIHYDLVCETVMQLAVTDVEAASFTLRSFASFSKALIAFIDQTGDLASFRQKIPDLCAFVVKNEYDSFEEQKYYLGRLLKSSETPDAKLRRLKSVVHDITDDFKKNPTANGSRLMKIVGPISEYYLSQYDLERAADFWNFVEKKDWLLHLILCLYRWPWLFASVAILVIALLTGFYKAIGHLSPQGILHNMISWSSTGLLGLAFTSVLATLALILWQFLFTRRGWDYVDLFMPRLLGAVIVGLSLLLFEDITWKIGLQMDWPVLIVVCVAVYELSFIYIFIDVHKTLRILPLLPEQNEKPLSRSIRTSFKVFLIGFSEAFLVVFFMSGLFCESVLSASQRSAGLMLQIGDLNVFGFFPKLIVLWTGLTLFIGAFAQLIWQDRRITSPL